MKLRYLFLALLATIAIASGCGDSGGAEESPATVDDAPPAQAQTEEARPEATGALAKKPKIAKQSGPPPKKIVKKDLITGKGQAAKSGDSLTMQYVGVLYDNGKQFDASWDRGEPFEFDLGAGMVIPGWDEGIVGMKVGGRRQLTIPPDKAYGDEGQPPDIPPNSTLVFVVDLIDIR